LYGAAVATVITYTVILFTYLKFLGKFTQVTPFRMEFLFTLVLAVLASAAMYFVIRWPAVYRLNVFLSIPVGVAVYLASLFLLKKIKELSLWKTSP
jgi:O-antigen/teichoic acid export membrane protein